MGPASEVLIALLSGRGLPDATLDSDLVVRDEGSVGKPLASEPPAPVTPFNPKLLPGDPANRPAIAAIANPAELSAPVDLLYGSWAVAHLDLARAAFLTRLGALPNLWKNTHPETGEFNMRVDMCLFQSQLSRTQSRTQSKRGGESASHL